MAVTGLIHWHEGLFLQPHHLQGMQKQLTDQFGSERRLLRSYPYGLVESRLSIRWPGMETSDFSVSLYRALPEEENRKP